MNRFWLVMGVGLMIGCSHSPTDTASQRSDDQTAVDDSAVYAQQLAQLRDQARSLESEMRFAEAVKIWQQIEKRISTDFGEESWQAINAKIAHKAASRNARLQESYSASLRDIARLQDQIKSVYAQGEHQQALDFSQELLRIQEPLFGDVSMDMARLKLQIGTLHSQLGSDEQALKNLHAGVEIFRAKGIELHPELEAALTRLAEIYSRQQNYRPAVANQKAATRLAGHLWGTDSLPYAHQANQLGVIFHRAGNDAVAYEILNTAQQIRQNQLGADSVECGHSCLNLGIVALSQQKLSEAEKFLRKARAIFAEKLGPGNEYSIRCNDQLATVMMLSNRPAVAEQLLGEVVEIGPDSISPDQLADFQYKLAIALARQGKYEAAEPLLHQILDQQTTINSSRSDQLSSTLKALAKIYEATHQNTKLESVRKQLNQISRVASGNDFQPRY